MKTYKNTAFKRDYSCINVVFIEAETKPNGDMWQECDPQELANSNCMYLWQENNKKLYGYM